MSRMHLRRSARRRQLDAMLAEMVARAEADISKRVQAEIETLATSTGLRFEEHERILDAIRAHWVEEKTDLAGQEFPAHYDVDGVLKPLFTQRLRRLASTRIRDERSRVASPDALLREAELVRDMSRALFGAAVPDFGVLAGLVTDGGRLEPSAVDRRLLAQVQRDVTELVRAIRATGHEVAFVFDLPRGSRADPDRYELWTSSIPGRPVAFVVTPGYEAAGRRIRPPSVITTERLTGHC